ncbi:MAG TPA: methyltransferase domain-containing protein [Gaiellaceae bacterium]|nr:methyltransferase domain-containing protein [Gaiellaceae bacterium]
MSAAEVWADRVLAGAALVGGEDVLGLGLDTGPLAFRAHELVDDGWVIAVDPSVDALEELLRHAHELGSAGVMYLVGDADVLPLPDAAVDACVGRFPCERVEDLAEAVRELLRVLRPGGRVSLLDRDGDGTQLAAALGDAGFAGVAFEPATDGTGAAVTARRP